MMTFSYSLLLTLAWRNLWRNKRRSLIMLAAIVLGVWAMIFMSAFLRGMVDEMVRGASHTFLGHVQVHHSLYRDDPTVVNSMAPPTPSMLTALASKEVVAWTTRVRVPAVVASERETRGVTLMGIEPKAEAQMSFLAAGISQGRYLQDEDKGVVIGESLAKRMSTGLGKRIVVMTQDPDNNIVDRGFRIVGLYRANPRFIEDQFIFITLKQAQGFLQMAQNISELELLGDSYRDTSGLIRTLKPVISEEVTLLSWTEQDAYLASMLELMDGFILVWIIVVFLALCFGLVNTLMMAVFERVRELGLMAALGMRPSMIIVQILGESLLLLCLGLLLGNFLAWACIAPLQGGIDISALAEGLAMAGMGTVLYPSLAIADMLMASVVVIVLGLFASLYPAWRASRFSPVKALSAN